MCHRVTCPSCGKPTYAGCGMHVEQALQGVPSDARCKCDEKRAATASKGPKSASRQN